MDKDFKIEISQFNEGQSPLAHIDDKTFLGNRGQASEMKADIISKPGYVTQSPALQDLTNGNQSGVVDQLIRHILDRPVSSTTTYAVGTTKLFKLSSTTVASGGSPSWPQTITDMTEGESVIRLKNNLFIFYNKASGGDIATMPLDTEVIDPDWGSSTDQALEKAPHPSAVKEDILVFGNGRYLGVYVEGLGELDTQKLDFGDGSEVVDVVFHANVWWVAVNYGEGKHSQIYMYDGSALSNILSDEAGVGDQQIGFLFLHNGNIFLAYDDTTSDGYAIGWLSGRSIKPLRYFKGTLPTHRQKALYKNTILFASGANVLSCGAVVEQLPIQVSTICDAGHSTVGAIATPFGVPLIASSDGSGNHRLAKFSGYSTDSIWKSVFTDTCEETFIGLVNVVIVLTKPLGSNAKCVLTLQGNQANVAEFKSGDLVIEGEGVSRHVFRNVGLPPSEDLRAVLDWSSGDTTNDCPIRKIIIMGSYVER